jgi:V/A-type H+-transporting ATPase subunit K
VYISRRLGAITGLVFVCLLAVSPCWAGDEIKPAPMAKATVNPEEAKSDWVKGMTAIAAALAVGLCALATGLAQSRIGAAGCGTLAEKPETAGTIILLVAIPETMVILGFVVAVVLLFAA